MAEEEKKIIVDEDWKKEAKAEKEKLAAEEQMEKKEAQQAGQQQRGQIPPGDFSALVSLLVTQALYAMGAIQVEGQPQREPDLDLAKYNIDMLGTLEEKTKGNLSEQEAKVLENTLSQVRMAYVQISSGEKQE